MNRVSPGIDVRLVVLVVVVVALVGLGVYLWLRRRE
jgi:hypothetical protein